MKRRHHQSHTKQNYQYEVRYQINENETSAVQAVTSGADWFIFHEVNIESPEGTKKMVLPWRLLFLYV